MVIFNYLFKKNVTKHYVKVKKNVTNYVTTMKGYSKLLRGWFREGTT